MTPLSTDDSASPEGLGRGDGGAGFGVPLRADDAAPSAEFSRGDGSIGGNKITPVRIAQPYRTG